LLDKPAYHPDEIEFFFSREKEVLNEYFKVRDAVYLEQFNLPNADILHDAYDDKPYTEFIIIKHGKKIIGGGRLIFHFLGTDTLLPFEAENFLLKNILPELDLGNKSYLGVDRVALLKDYRHGDTGREIIRLSDYRGQELGINYIFTVNPPIQARLNKRHCSALGFDFHIRTDIEIPDKPSFNGKKMLLTTADLNHPNHSTRNLFPK